MAKGNKGTLRIALLKQIRSKISHLVGVNANELQQ